MSESNSIQFNNEVDENVLNNLFQTADVAFAPNNPEPDDAELAVLFQSANNLYGQPQPIQHEDNTLQYPQQPQILSQSLHFEELQTVSEPVGPSIDQQHFDMENLIEQSLMQSSVDRTQLGSDLISSLQQFNQLVTVASHMRNQLANNAIQSKNHQKITLNIDDVEQLALLFRTLFGQLSYHKIMFFLSYKQQNLLTKMNIDVQFYKNYMIKLPVIDETKILSQLDDQPSIAKAKEQIQEQLYKNFEFDDVLFQNQLQAYNQFIAKGNIHNQQLIQRNLFLINEVNTKIETEKQFLHFYSSLQFMGVDDIHEFEKFENSNQCIVLYFNPTYVFTNDILKEISNILDYKQVISFPKIYQFTIKYGIRKLDYNDLCCKLVILLSYYMENIEHQQIHPVLLVYQLIQLIKQEQKIISGQPIISQFYNKDVLPSGNSYNFLNLFHIKKQKCLILTDGFYLIKCQILKIKQQYSNGQIYTFFNPQIQGFSSEQQYLLNQDNLSSNYLVCYETQIQHEENQKIGLYKYKTQYQLLIQRNQVISHHAFIVIDQINLLLVLISINTSEIYYFISKEQVNVSIGQIIHIFQFIIKQAFHTKVNIIQSTMYYPSENKELRNAICKTKEQKQRYQMLNKVVNQKLSNLLVAKVMDESLILGDENDNIYVFQIYMMKSDTTIQQIIQQLVIGNFDGEGQQIIQLQYKKIELFNVFHETTVQSNVFVNRLYFILGVSDINMSMKQQNTLSENLKEKLLMLNIQIL